MNPNEVHSQEYHKHLPGIFLIFQQVSGFSDYIM